MPTMRHLGLVSILAIGLSACAPSDNYDANGNFRGASDHGGTYQPKVTSDDDYYRTGNDSTNRHHKHNTIATPSNVDDYDHNNDPDNADTDYPGTHNGF